MKAILLERRPAVVALMLCVAIGAANALAQSQPSSVSDSLFTREPVLNAPFIADAVTTLVPSKNGTIRSVTDRYYRDSAGRVRAERHTPKGALIIIDPDPGDNSVTVLQSDTAMHVRAPMMLAQYHFHSTSDTTAPRLILDRGMMGGTRTMYETSPDLGVVVRARQLHPDHGTIEFRLTNIRRQEPASELFQIPASYLPAPPHAAVDLDVAKR